MIPTSLLTDIRQTWLCSLMIRARQKSLHIQPGDEQSAVLYDYCMEHGLTKLAPVDWEDHVQIDSRVHRWIVRDICQTSYLHGPEPLNEDQISAVSVWLTGGRWSCPRNGVFYLDRGILGPGDGRTKYELMMLVHNQSQSGPRFRFYQVADKLGLLPPCPGLVQFS